MLGETGRFLFFIHALLFSSFFLTTNLNSPYRLHSTHQLWTLIHRQTTIRKLQTRFLGFYSHNSG